MFCFYTIFLLMFTSPCSCCEYVIPAGHVVRPAKRGSMHPDLSERKAPCIGGSEREHPGARAPVHGRALQDRGPRCRGTLLGVLLGRGQWKKRPQCCLLPRFSIKVVIFRIVIIIMIMNHDDHDDIHQGPFDPRVQRCEALRLSHNPR